MPVVKKNGVRAKVSTPSLSVVVNRGTIRADTLNSQPVAAIQDSLTLAKVIVPFGYVLVSNGPPTDTPPEFNGFVPLRLDILNGVLYYYLSGVWYALASGSAPATVDNAFMFGNGDFMTFGDGSTIQLGG